MNKGELVTAVAETAGLSKGDAGRAIEATLHVIARALGRGDTVKIVGFGTFAVSARRAGEARNPRTGEAVQVAAQKTPKFRAGAQLRKAVNSQ